MNISSDNVSLFKDDKMDICTHENNLDRTKEFIKYFSFINKFGIIHTNKYYVKCNLALLTFHNKLTLSKYIFNVPEDFEKIQALGINYINYYPNIYHQYNVSRNNKLIILFGTTIINNITYNIVSNIVVSFKNNLPKIIDHCLFIM
ncbi:hypothetical protein QJ854_gp587 [Moumouvirus goulette]|uniref:Uncharacterized protein n=1 Tax=Moumouvirus goulette TaxID=1247379 RepID=M1NMC8_9VIRU|nr:hypothetical protein QJ854_gp587 [Moumouvirus goulette]AGF85195.1 hypothetical protein glt_00386 [Moumouvirus goulette]